MAYQSQPVEINTFNAGLITDASPLTSPENSSLEEENFVLNLDGSRQRRLGMDFQQNSSVVVDTEFQNPRQLSTFLWENAGGTGENFLVVFTGNRLNIFSTEQEPYSSNIVFTFVLYPAPVDILVNIDMTSINGMLVFPLDSGAMYVEYDGDTFRYEFSELQVRDLFGVDDVIGDVDYLESNNIATRPETLTQEHRYNLRNQGWGIPRPYYATSNWPPGGETTEVGDPITVFYENTEEEYYPSNSDSVTQSLIADPTAEESPTLRRFTPEDLIKNPIGSMPSAKGYFIINPFSRSISRESVYSENQNRYPELNYNLSSLPNDFTNVFGSSITIERFAGRVFYAGYSSDTADSIKTSPTINSFIFFSKVVKSPRDIYKCFQENDPTSPDFPDILDTDGGFINITGAENIYKLHAMSNGLLVLAENGVWIIRGTSDNGFTATSYSVEKITDRGCISKTSVVSVASSVFYWGRDGIYVISPNQYGELEAQRITEGRIQNLYLSINERVKKEVHGIYDVMERKIKWLYDNQIDFSKGTKELILDLQLNAFYINHIKGYDTLESKPIGYINIAEGSKSLEYISVRMFGGQVGYAFSNYTDEEFIDWKSVNGIGVDASAFLVTSYFSGGDFQRNKGIPYLTTHLRRTETGMAEEDGQTIYLNSSSCIVQAQWDWSDSNVSNKWGKPFQAYRYKKEFIPQTLPNPFDTGFSTIVTKHKLRGSGKVVSLKFSTEPGKDLHLYGWSMVFAISGIV